MTKINLLYIITKLELGGAQKQLLNLIQGLDKQSFNIFLLTAKDGLLVKEAQSLDNLILERSRFLERAINPLKDLLALIEIYFFIRKNKIQIAHTHSSKAGILGRLAARLARVKIIIHTVHGWSFHDYQFKLVNRLYWFLEKICAGFTTKIITVCLADKKKGLNNSIGSEDQYAVVGYGINYNDFQNQLPRASTRELLGFNQTDLLVGMVACFKPQKSPLDFIKLAAAVKNKIPQVKFIMVGEGVLFKKSAALIRKLNLNQQVILAGWRSDIPLILSSLDLFVLTSLWEGLPIVALEAMASGVPVVLTDTGGIAEVVISGQSGYLAKPGDLILMQKQIERLLLNPSLREDFIRLSRAVIAAPEFSLNNMIKHTEELYFNLRQRYGV